MIVVSRNYDRSFIVLANGISIVNYDRKIFTVQATDKSHCHVKSCKSDQPKYVFCSPGTATETNFYNTSGLTFDTGGRLLMSAGVN